MEAIGMDIVDVSRIERVLKKWGDRFRTRVFTAGEIRYCEGKRCPARHYAARYAAKEAFFKSAGDSIPGGWVFRDIEVATAKSGRPFILLSGRMAESLRPGGTLRWDVSLTHEKQYAAAVVFLSGRLPEETLS